MKLREGSFPVLVLSGLLLVLVVVLVVPPTGSYDTAPRLLVTLTSTIVPLSTSHPQSKYTISSQPRLRAHLCHSASEYLLVQLFSALTSLPINMIGRHNSRRRSVWLSFGISSRTSFQKEHCIVSLFRMTRCPSVKNSGILLNSNFFWIFLQYFPSKEQQWTTSRSSRYLYLIFLPSSHPVRAGYIVLVMNMTNVAVNWLERGRELGPVPGSKLNINRSHADNGSAYQFASSIISLESITQTINRKSETVFLFSSLHLRFD